MSVKRTFKEEQNISSTNNHEETDAGKVTKRTRRSSIVPNISLTNNNEETYTDIVTKRSRRSSIVPNISLTNKNHETDTDKVTQRSRRLSMAPNISSTNNHVETDTGKVTQRSRRLSMSQSNASNINIVAPAAKSLLKPQTLILSETDTIKELFDEIKVYRSPIEKRLLSETFTRLPAKRGNAEYYELIKEPIDMLKISQKIKIDQYKSFTEFDTDFKLLISNAKLFYKKDSQEYKDACGLMDLYETLKKEKNLNVAAASVDKDHETNTSFERKSRGRSISSTNNAKSPPNKSESNSGGSPTLLLPESNPNLQLYLEDYFNILCTHKDTETSRILAVVFYLLPSSKTYPDYYVTIEKPIDIKTIAKNIKTLVYKSIKQLESDFNLMMENAKRFNSSKSIIYKDACRLKRLSIDTSKLLSKLMGQNKLYDNQNDENAIDDLSKRQAKKNLIDQLSELTQSEFNKRLAEAEAQAACSETLDKKENNLDDTQDENKEVESSTKVKNKKEKNLNASNEEDHDEEAENDEEENEADTSKNRAHTHVKRNHPLILAMWSLFNHIKEKTNEENQTLIDPFIKLPSKRTYPDYYKDIKQPISLNIIKSKLKKRFYASLNDLDKDFHLLFSNAMQYNVETSIIYDNAKQLMQTFKEKSAELALTDVGKMILTSNSDENQSPNSSITTVLTPMKHKKQNNDTPIIDSNVLPKFTDLKEKLTYLYTYMLKFQMDERELAQPFLHLPSKIEYADYYNIIKKPIDMTKILQKINQVGKSTDYGSVEDLCADFAQMFENACIYNEPNSIIYKDALNMQRALFLKKDEISKQESLIDYTEQLSPNFIPDSVQDLIQQLFDSCMKHEDSEGRLYSDSFLQLYTLIENEQTLDLVTLEYMRNRVKSRTYKRLDVFQEEMFLFFNQIRQLSYIEGDYKLKPDQNLDSSVKKIHRYSQLYRDTYELQCHFIRKRDELCRNGDLLLSSALNFKINALDSHLSVTIGGQTFDESEALLVDKRFKVLENKLNEMVEEEVKHSNLIVGNFYYMNRKFVLSNLEQKLEFTFNDEEDNMLVCCVLASNSAQTKFIVQPYLRINSSDQMLIDSNLVKVRKFLTNEIFKSDLYALINLSEMPNSNEQKILFRKCFVIGIKDYLNNDISISNVEGNSLNSDLSIQNDVYICESMYSTRFNYFRKLVYQKWEPLKFIGLNNESNMLSITEPKLEMTKRVEPSSHIITAPRKFLDESLVKIFCENIDTKLTNLQNFPSFFKPFYCNTVQYDTPPAKFKEEKEPDEPCGGTDPNLNQHTIEEDTELMKTAKYYEQLVFNSNDIYKIGDYVYVQNNQLVKLTSKNPLIVRIDRLWSVMVTGNGNEEPAKKFYLRGPLFLRPNDIEHEPTRLFFHNEVFREQSREITISLDQIVSGTSSGSKKCTVLSNKKYVSSRCTEIDERDVFICEAKYSLHLKTFRKFTKGIRKFELSVKCDEDEIYFLKRELQLKKHLSPILMSMNIVYDDNDVDDNSLNQKETNENQSLNSYWQNNDVKNADIASGTVLNNDEYDDDEASNSQEFDNTNLMDITTTGQASPMFGKIKQTSLLGQNGGTTGKKIRQKRDRKSAYNIFSRDYRKSLRDTKSSLSFELMSKEVGNRWRELTPQQRAEYEEKARIETLAEMKKLAAEREAQAQAQRLEAQQQQQQQQQQSLNNISSPLSTNHLIAHIQNNQQQSMYLIANGSIQQQQQPKQQQPNSYVIYQPQTMVNQQPQPSYGPKQIQHKEAYIRYISNLRKQQQLSYSTTYNSGYNPIGTLPQSDWQKSLDVRMSQIKEKKVMPPPSSWIENCGSNDVLKHLASLRYYMLNDAINAKFIFQNEYENTILVNEDDEEKENTSSEPILMEL